MRLLPTPALYIVTSCLGMASCAVQTPATPRQLVDMPIASKYADATFTLTTLSAGPVRDEPFARQISRVADRLQEGAWKLYPDLEQQIPNVAGGRFAVYAIDADEPGSVSTADGRVALNSGLAYEAPDDAWVAFVIAREMGHVIARHPEENSVLGLLASVALNIVVPGSGLVKTAISTAGSTLAAGSKQNIQAREADTIALRLLKASGYPLRDVARSLQNAPPLDDSRWARSFRKSRENLIVEARNSPSPMMSSGKPSSGGRPPAVTPRNRLAQMQLPDGGAVPNDTDRFAVPLNTSSK